MYFPLVAIWQYHLLPFVVNWRRLVESCNPIATNLSSTTVAKLLHILGGNIVVCCCCKICFYSFQESCGVCLMYKELFPNYPKCFIAPSVCCLKSTCRGIFSDCKYSVVYLWRIQIGAHETRFLPKVQTLERRQYMRLWIVLMVASYARWVLSDYKYWGREGERERERERGGKCVCDLSMQVVGSTFGTQPMLQNIYIHNTTYV